MGLRLIVNEQLSIVIHDLGKEYRLGVKTSVCNGSKGRGKLQVGYAFGDAAQGSCRVHVGVGQSGDAEVLGVFHAQLRAYGFHHGAHGNDVHGVDNTVADAGVAEITLLIPVFKGFGSYREWRVVINASQGSAAGIQRRGKGGDDLEGGTRLSGSISGTV